MHTVDNSASITGVVNINDVEKGGTASSSGRTFVHFNGRSQSETATLLVRQLSCWERVSNCFMKCLCSPVGVNFIVWGSCATFFAVSVNTSGKVSNGTGAAAGLLIFVGIVACFCFCPKRNDAESAAYHPEGGGE